MNPQAALQTIAEAGAANVAVAHALALSAVTFAERVSAVHLEFVRASLDQAADFPPPASGNAGWQEYSARQTAAMRETAERTGEWFRGVCEAGSEAQAAAAEAVSSRLAEISDAVMALGATAPAPKAARKAA